MEIEGGTSTQATLDVASAAGFGTVGVLSGNIVLSGDALLEFAGKGQLTTIDGSLALHGANSYVAAAGLGVTSNSALLGLTNLNGTLNISDGARVKTNGPLTIAQGGELSVAEFGDGTGSTTMTIGGTLSIAGDDLVFIGPNGTKQATVSAGGLVNNGNIFLEGTDGKNSRLLVSGPSTNAGNMQIDSGIAYIGASVDTGGTAGATGNMSLLADATLRLGGSVAQGETITFDSGNLLLGDASSFQGTVAQFSPDESIDLIGFGAGTELFRFRTGP